ncbi:hypothetical protein DFS33DRAFT_1457370 [Desarmillaria ectypa]|nr:hypothetical protein DFS33DRAFT_1457370 [Desarmillaria ectypa]
MMPLCSSRAKPMGIYGTSIFHQGDASTPAPHPILSSSQCTTVSVMGGGTAAMSATTTMTLTNKRQLDRVWRALERLAVRVAKRIGDVGALGLPSLAVVGAIVGVQFLFCAWMEFGFKRGTFV